MVGKMWLHTSQHSPDYQAWLREEERTRAQLLFSTGRQARQQQFVKSLSGETQCGTVCRLPSSLSPLSPARPRPRPWLEGEEAWASARREVEQRRDRVRREELQLVEQARRRLERDQSEAVRLARTKLLDQVISSSSSSSSSLLKIILLINCVME